MQYLKASRKHRPPEGGGGGGLIITMKPHISPIDLRLRVKKSSFCGRYVEM